MKVLVRSTDSRPVPWAQSGVERLRQALHHLQQLLAVDRPREALALIPIRAGQPPAARRHHPRSWHD